MIPRQPLPKYYIILSFAAILVGIFFLYSNFPTQVSSVDVVKHQPRETTLVFGGDIMLSRNVAGEIFKTKDNVLPFRNIASEFQSADIAFANLESPYLDKPPFAQQGLIFKAHPDTIEGLKFAGFDILSTANNHALDQLEAGIDFTRNWLTANQIKPLGTGDDCHNGIVAVKNGIRFGFLGYSYTAYNDNGTTHPKVCDAQDTQQVKADVATLKAKVDFLIVSNHMGIEYTRKPSEAQVAFSHAAIDAGADMIVGHHPHWVQTIDQYKGKWIFNSLGNLVFDQMWSQDTKEGLVVKVKFSDRKLEKLELKPVIIENFCCPKWANEIETKNILQKIDLTSTAL